MVVEISNRFAAVLLECLSCLVLENPVTVKGVQVLWIVFDLYLRSIPEIK